MIPFRYLQLLALVVLTSILLPSCSSEANIGVQQSLALANAADAALGNLEQGLKDDAELSQLEELDNNLQKALVELQQGTSIRPVDTDKLTTYITDTLSLTKDLQQAVARRQTRSIATSNELRAQISSLKDSLSKVNLPRPIITNEVTQLLQTILWFAIFCFVISLLFSTGIQARLGKFLQQFKSVSVSVLGSTLVWDRDVVQRIEEVFGHSREESRKRFNGWVEQNDFQRTFDNFIKNNIIPYLQNKNKDLRSLRATIHVPDIMFTNALYQLLDYYSVSKDNRSTKGRPFTIRFGMIGRAWRLGEHEYSGRVPTEPTELIKDWGMTYEEATQAGQNRQSLLAFLLKDEHGKKLGILYMDAEDQDLFAPATELCELISHQSTQAGIIKGLSGLHTELLANMAPLRIFEK